MKKLLLFLLLFFCSFISIAQVHVRGYYRKNGTYVQPHERTRPNHTVTDNYSHPGNYNPNTGKVTGGSRIGADVPSAKEPTSGYSSNNERKLATSPVKNDYVPVLPTTERVVSSQLYAEVESNAFLKKEPNYMATSTYAIPKGIDVKIAAHNEYYYLAEVNGRTGYVCACQVKRTFTKP